MCTVTYLPTPTGFILTSNRDEKTQRRPALLPAWHEVNGKKILYPKDPVGGGSWIATDGQDRTVCLLNGANLPHIPSPPYKQSRGLVVLDYFQYAGASSFEQEYEFNGIEPFTLLILEGSELYEGRWDAQAFHLRGLEPNKPYIYSSSTLYPPHIKAMREQWFQEWLVSNPIYTQEGIINFHATAGSGDKTNGLLMNREDIFRTVSITSFEYSRHDYSIQYYDTATQILYTESSGERASEKN